MCEELSWEEVMEVMKCLEERKDNRPDRIMNEMLMYGRWTFGGGDVADDNVVMKSECCPLDWKRSLLVPFHKDGDVEGVRNYRGIVLGFSEVKVFVRVLARRFAEDRILTEAQ